MNKIYAKLRHSLPSICEVENTKKNTNRSAEKLK